MSKEENDSPLGRSRSIPAYPLTTSSTIDVRPSCRLTATYTTRGEKLITTRSRIAFRRTAGATFGAVLVALATTLLVVTPAHAADSTIWLQRNLAGIVYLPTSGVDGNYGPQTRAAARGFQHDNGLNED